MWEQRSFTFLFSESFNFLELIFFCSFVMHFNYICKLCYWFLWNIVYKQFALVSLCSANFARQSLPRYIFSRWTRNICFVLAFVPYFICFFFSSYYTSSGFKMFLKLQINATMNWFHHKVSTILFSICHLNFDVTLPLQHSYSLFLSDDLQKPLKLSMYHWYALY